MASITHRESDAGLSLSSFFVWSFTIKDLHMTALPSRQLVWKLKTAWSLGLEVTEHHFYYILLLRTDYEIRADSWVEKWIFPFDERSNKITLRRNMHTDMGEVIRPIFADSMYHKFYECDVNKCYGLIFSSHLFSLEKSTEHWLLPKFFVLWWLYCPWLK